MRCDGSAPVDFYVGSAGGDPSALQGVSASELSGIDGAANFGPTVRVESMRMLSMQCSPRK